MKLLAEKLPSDVPGLYFAPHLLNHPYRIYCSWLCALAHKRVIPSKGPTSSEHSPNNQQPCWFYINSEINT